MRCVLIALAPFLAKASTPCVKHSVLAKDPLLPAPSVYAESWTSCQKSCQESLLCSTFSFKKDTSPEGGCWLFPKTATLKEEEDIGAFTGPKACEPAPVPKELPDAPPAEDGDAGDAKAGLRGYGIPAAAAHSYGVANAGKEIPGGVFAGETAGKSLVATPSRGDVSNLAVAAGFGAAAVAVGAYFMVPRTKKNKKRALQREETDGLAAAPLVQPQMMYPMAAPMPLTPLTYSFGPMVPQGMAQGMAQGPCGVQGVQGGEYMVVEPVTAMSPRYEQPMLVNHA